MSQWCHRPQEIPAAREGKVTMRGNAGKKVLYRLAAFHCEKRFASRRRRISLPPIPGGNGNEIVLFSPRFRPQRLLLKDLRGHEHLNTLIRPATRASIPRLPHRRLNSRHAARRPTGARIPRRGLKETRRRPARGIPSLAKAVQRWPCPFAATYIGPGKANEFASYCKEDELRWTRPLSEDGTDEPAQTPVTWEKIFRLARSWIRTALIWKFLAKRPHAGGKLQIRPRAASISAPAPDTLRCTVAATVHRLHRPAKAPPSLFLPVQLEADRRGKFTSVGQDNE